VLRWSLGSLAYYAAAFVREDEEGAVQNRLETWWIRLMYSRDAALSQATVFMSGIAQLADRAFEVFLGEQLWSLQAVGVSVWFSLASGSISVILASYVLPHLIPRLSRTMPQAHFVPMPPVSFHTWLVAAACIVMGLLPWLFGRGTAFLTWALFIVVQVAASVGFGMFVTQTWGYASLFRIAGRAFLILLSSFGFDVLYITLTRWMLRRLPTMTRIYEIVVIILLDVLLALILVFVPIEGGLFLMTKSANIQTQMTGFWSVSVLLFNFGDIFACSVFFVLMVLMLGHRLLWPALERPIYAFHRYGLIRRKAWLWGIGTALGRRA